MNRWNICWSQIKNVAVQQKLTLNRVSSGFTKKAWIWELNISSSMFKYIELLVRKWYRYLSLWPSLFWWSRQHYAPLTFSKFVFCLLRLLLLSAEQNGNLKSTWALFFQSKPFAWWRNRFALWRNLQGKVARAFISQSEFILLTIRTYVQACHISCVSCECKWPSVGTEAPRKLS